MQPDNKKLAKKKCIACDKHAKPLSLKEAQLLLGHLKDWKLSKKGKWIKKSYTFKNFEQSLSFANQIGAIAEKENHHPDITFGWGYMDVKLQTHSVHGLHENDFIIAAKIDSIQ